MLRIGTKKTEFVVVCATYGKGLDERRFTVLHGVFSSSNSDYWEFVNPASFVSFFIRKRNGAARAETLMSTLAELKKLMPDYVDLGVSQTSGELMAHFSWRGKLKGPPRGSAVASALAQSSESALAAAGERNPR